jgi:predicted phosphodiesterase
MPAAVPTLAATGPVLLFGGPYGNLHATQAVLAAAAQAGIAADHVICTGDLVAYCGAPTETIAAVRAAGILVVMGNCDEHLASGADDCGCGFDPGSACDRLSAAWYAYASSVVGADDRRYLAGLPRSITLVIGGARLRIVHGSVARINAFVFAGTPVADKRAELAAADPVDGIVGGHCGLPFTEVIDGRLWHNPGVVGMPANDGTARVWYSVLTPMPGGGVAIAHRALAYDHAGAADAMRAAGLPAAYRDALASGLWPNLDVLPTAERAATGVALAATATDHVGITWRPGPASHGVLWPVAADARAATAA